MGSAQAVTFIYLEHGPLDLSTALVQQTVESFSQAGSGGTHKKRRECTDRWREEKKERKINILHVSAFENTPLADSRLTHLPQLETKPGSSGGPSWVIQGWTYLACLST